MDKWKKIAELIGVEVNENFGINASNDRFYINEGLINSDTNNHEPGILYRLLRGDYEIDRWPEKGDKFYYPDIQHIDGINFAYWGHSKLENRIKNRVGIYRTKEEAEKKAKELGWQI